MENLKDIIEAINDDIESNEEYATNDPDCGTAEFVHSFGYGETDTDDIIKTINSDHNGDGDFDHVISYLKALKPSDLFSLLADHCSLETADIYRATNEIYGMNLGEIEVQLDDAIVEALAKLSPEDRETVSDGINAYLQGDFVYIDLNYNRWVMVLDFESLTEAVNEIKVYPKMKLV